jgi:hypothetical protein
VLLCRASDAPQEPQPRAFYQALFGTAQRDLLFDYFDAVSDHALNVSGSEVFGWFGMSVNTATLSPAVRNNSLPVTRTQTARDCRASALGAIAATGQSVDPANYAGVITVINVPVDSGDAGERSLVLFQQAENEVGFVAHEMLHVLGLDHSWRASADGSSDHAWKHGGDTEYGDCWDMMSFRTCVYTFQSTRGAQGPELEGAYREKLHWLPAGRLFTVGAYAAGIQTIALAPLGDPGQPGYLLAKIEVPNQGYYLVEYREAIRFDRGIPARAVVIREQRNNGLTYLVQRQGGAIAWQMGDAFTDTANYLRISVDDIHPGGATITINPAYSTAPAQLGDICGDKYRGQVVPCAGAAQCGPRVTPPIQTIDWFCQ